MDINSQEIVFNRANAHEDFYGCGGGGSEFDSEDNHHLNIASHMHDPDEDDDEQEQPANKQKTKKRRLAPGSNREMHLLMKGSCLICWAINRAL